MITLSSSRNALPPYLCPHSSPLRYQQTIQRTITAGLLLLSLISFLPKAYFHEALATHKDGVSCTHTDRQTPCVHKQGYNCSFTDLVVTAPYQPVTYGFCLLPPVCYCSFTPSSSFFLLSKTHLSAESRGPPSFKA